MSDLFTGLTTSLKSAATAITKNEHVRKFADVMNDTIMNYSEAELAVREATNEDPWGPTGPQMKKIVEYTKSRRMEDFYNVYTPLFVRMLQNNKDAWRRVYKSLVLFEYLLKNGSERFVNESKEKIYEIRRLESYKFIDEKGKDQGINIRHRAKLILDLMNDDDKLREERNKATTDDKSKYRGYDQYDMKHSSSGFGSSSGSSSWKNNSSSSEFSSNFEKKEPREVSNFSFAAENRSPSPELGFVEAPTKQNNADDDDGFGDFVSSRSSATPAPTSVNTVRAQRSDDLFAAHISPPPSATKVAALPRKPSLTNETSNVDLLGGFSSTAAPTPAAAPANTFDIFSQIPAPVTNTAPPTTNNVGGGLDIFGFGSTNITPTPVATNPTPASNTFGGLNDFVFDSIPTTQPVINASASQSNTTPNKTANSPKVGDSFAGLDQFMNLSLGSTGSNQPKAKTLNQMMGQK